MSYFGCIRFIHVHLGSLHSLHTQKREERNQKKIKLVYTLVLGLLESYDAIKTFKEKSSQKNHYNDNYNLFMRCIMNYISQLWKNQVKKDHYNDNYNLFIRCTMNYISQLLEK